MIESSVQEKFQSLNNFTVADEISWGGEDLQRVLKKHKISPSEYQSILAILGRKPSFTELGIFSAMWSEHCSYKSSKVHLKKLPTTGPQVVVGPGENAGVVRLKDSLCVAFKMESHNHPSYIEPYQGAATGVGGILRDVFCMGARPIANLNCLRFGSKSHPKTRHLVENVVKGIGDYGNCVGIPTVGGTMAFDPSYDGNCLVNAMTVGLIHEDQIFKGFANGPGNLVVYVGSATGRDGIHGATMASDSFASQTQGERSAVQVGDPFTEKLLLEATLEALRLGLVIGLQDMGAAGLTSSSFEMADRAGTGIYIDLDRVPVRTQNMSAYELMLSESQERMLMVIEPKNWQALRAMLAKWELAHDVIGVVTDSGRMQISYQGVLEVNLPIAPLADSAPQYERPYEVAEKLPGLMSEAASMELSQQIAAKGLQQVLDACLAATSGQAWVCRQYDHHIGSRTRFHSGHGGAAVMHLWDERAQESGLATQERLGLAISSACSVRYCAANAKFGGLHGILKSARMIAAAGGVPLAATDCMNFGNPERPVVMGQFVDAVAGISEACKALQVAIVSGNVSLYNETDGVSIVPTPMIGMVGRVDDITLSKPARTEGPGYLYLLRGEAGEPGFGSSLVAELMAAAEQKGAGAETSLPYPISWRQEQAAMALLPVLFQRFPAISACRDIGDGGLLTTLAKMLGTGMGAELKLGDTPVMSELFAERAASYLIVSGEAIPVGFMAGMAGSELVLEEIGRIREGEGIQILPSLSVMPRVWDEPLH